MAVALVLVFGLALFLRLYFVYGLAFNTTAVSSCTSVYTPPYSGGSDSYYWDRALCYSFQTGRDLGTDPMLNYPVSLNNPRPPLFPWFSLLVGRLFAPLFANAWQSVLYTFLLSTGLFGALTVFPTYALGKEAFGRKAGLIGALLLAVSVGHLQRSASTDADHDAFTLFFVVCTFYFFLRALRSMHGRRWVENWFLGKSIRAGVGAFFRENRTSVLYALLSGICVAVIALAWQGWSYVAVILLVWFGVEMFFDRFRNEDTMGTWLLFGISVATPLLLAFPWYYTRGIIGVWYDVPAYLFLATFVFGLAITVTRDYPWTIVIPGTLTATGVALGAGALIWRGMLTALLSGAGYFIQSKAVSTIAEDQSPGLSQIILSFGWFTFIMSLAAVAYLLWQIPRRRDPGYNIVVIWVVAAIFMAITAARFIFNASPAFAISAGFAVHQILVRANFAEMRRTYRSLAEGSWRNAIRKSIKLRHILATLGIVFLVLLPNVWWAVDASIPFELKQQYDRQVGGLLPTFLRSPGYSPTGGGAFYFGAFGYSIPRPSEYYPAAWQWFARQDSDRPPEFRPAYLSWWDYGFEAVDRGVHPTVADNFLDGYALAGQFITAQNETQGIALLAVRVLEGDLRHHRPAAFSPAVVAVLRGAGLSDDLFRDVFVRPQTYVSAVLSDPARYGLWAPDLISLNAQYIFLTRLLVDRLDKEGVVSFYHAVRDATGFDIGYFAVDARLFPISVQNTGIFYAPVKLSDHRVIQLSDGRILPVDFFQILASTADRQNVPIQEILPGEQVTGQTIQYRRPFYNSMFYRAYIGYSPTDLGVESNTGIPGFDSALRGFDPMPAWNLTHFRVVYRTVYYNPFTDPSNHTDAWRAMNYDEGLRMQADIREGKIPGIVDLSTTSTVANGVVFLRYYDGALVNGTVWAGSSPLEGIRITVTDELGTPHYTTRTDASGRYSAIVPFGDVTITASTGSLTRTTLVDSRILGSTSLHVTMEQAMRAPVDSNGDTVPDWIMSRDIQTQTKTIQGTAYMDLDRNGLFSSSRDLRASGASITLTHQDFPFRRTVTVGPDGSFSFDGLPTGLYGVQVTFRGHTVAAAPVSPGTSTVTMEDVSVPFSIVRGSTSTPDGPVASADLEFRDETNATVFRLRSGADGSYELGPLLEGNFTVNATSGEFAIVPTRTRASGTNFWLNLTLMPSGTAAGTTHLLGTRRAFVTLEFRSAADPRLIRTVTSDANGQYSIRLAAGEWSVSGRFYDGTQLFALLSRIVITSGTLTPLDATFVEGVRVTGVVRDPNPTVTGIIATVAFASASGELRLRTDDQGRYLAFLPGGTYDVEAFTASGAYFATVGLSASRALDIQLIAASGGITWRVYRDTNRNGVADAGEDIAGARIDLRDDRGSHVFLATPPTGTLTLPLFANRTYAGTVTATGYEVRSLPASTVDALRSRFPMVLAPLRAPFQGSVLLNGAPLVSHPVRVLAIGLSGGGATESAMSDSNGRYLLSLLPGTYSVLVDENVSTSRDTRYQNLGVDRLVVPLGQSMVARDLSIVVRYRVFGLVTLAGSPVDATITFDGPDHRIANATATGYETYLRSGNYLATGNRTIASKDYAFMTLVAVSAAANDTFAFTDATRVSGRTLFGGAAVAGPMPISFARQTGGTVTATTDAAGGYAVFLVPGTYAVTLDSTGSVSEGTATRFYRYGFSGSVTVVAGQTTLVYDLALSRTLDNTTLSGRATAAGFGVTARITFTARGGGGITAQTLTDSSGAYAISLAPGTYDVYATRTIGASAFLTRIAIPHSGAFVLNVNLVDAFLLSGFTTSPQGAPASGPVTIQSSSAQLDLTTDGRGQFTAVLPGDAYTVTATAEGTENTIRVSYRATTSVTLQSDAVVYLRLTKVVSRTATLTWDASERRTVSAGGSVAYTIVVRNTGNVPDTYTFSGSPAGWVFSFAPASLSLNFGTGTTSAVLDVTIRTPANALVDHGAVLITATSAEDGGTVGTVTVSVDVARVRQLSARLDTLGATFDGQRAEYVVLVSNLGNAKETVDIEIMNPGDLAAQGWTVRLSASGTSSNGTTLQAVAIDANQTARVMLQSQSTRGASQATVVLRVVAQDSAAVSATQIFTLQLPALAPGGITVTGPEITRAAPLNTLLIAVLAGAAAAVALALVLTRRRR